MRSEKGYGMLLAGILALLFVAGNLQAAPANALSVFPWAIAFLLFPLVLYRAIREIGVGRHGSGLTIIEGRQVGSSVSLIAAIAFGVFAAVFSLFYFHRPARTGAFMVVFAMTISVTYVVGWLWTLACARLVVRRLRGAGDLAL